MKKNEQSRVLFWATLALGIAATLLCSTPALAADIWLNADDSMGESSFATGLHWSDSTAPAAGNDYFTGNFRLRTPPDGNSYTFSGDSLTVCNTNGYSWGLMYKGSGNTGILTIPDLILDGGMISHGNGLGDLCQIDGAITVISASELYAKQGNIDILADLFGSGDLVITTPDASGEDDRYVTLFGDNSGFSGNIDVSGHFRVDETSGLTFVIGADGVNNSVLGTGRARFNGTFAFDLTAAGTNPGDSWTIATVADQAYSATFAVDGFTEVIPGIWDGTDYWFDAATSTLYYGEPATEDAVFLNAGGDEYGTSSFISAGAWNDGLAPSAGKDYVVTVQFLRSPADAVNYEFEGDTLTFRTGGAMISKHSAGRTLTANWILDGGLIRSGSGGDALETLAGTLDVTSNGGEIRADQTPYTITAPISGTGTLHLSYGYAITIAGINTFTGDVNATGTNLIWQDGSSWTFDIGSNGVNNQIAGTGSATFDGTFVFDLTDASTTPGDIWTIVDVATQNFGSNFTIDGFTEVSTGIWTSGNYRFDESTGVLSVGAPAGTWDGDVSNLWNVGENWTSDILPNFFGFGSELTFADYDAAAGTIINDVVDAEIGTIVFSAGEKSFVLDGNPIEMAGAFSSISSNGQEVAFDVAGHLEFNSAYAPITASGVLSGTNGLDQAGEAPLILTNASNDFSGMVNFTGLGEIVVAGSGALGDPASEIQINAYFQGPLASLTFDGGVSQEKIYRLWARAISDPPHMISTNGLNSIDGEIYGGSGGDRFIILSELGSTLEINTDFVQSEFATGTDVVRCDGNGEIDFYGDLDDSDPGSTLAIMKTNGDDGTLSLIGNKTYNGNTTAASGTIALIDATSSNNVTSSGLLEMVSTNGAGTFDFSGLLGGGIVLTSTQTLAGHGAVAGSVHAVSGTTIIPGSDAPGTIEFPSLTLDSGVQLNVQLGEAGSDLITIGAGGTLVGPSSGTVAINVEPSGGISASAYVLIDWSNATTVTDVDLADFSADGGTLSIVNNQLLLTFDLTSQADVLVADTGNDQILKYNVTELGLWVPDPVQPVFAQGVVGLYDLTKPGPLAKDSAGNIYVAETEADLEDRIMKLDADGNHLATVAEVASFEANLDISGVPAYIAIDPTDTYLFVSIDEPNSVASDSALEDVIYRVDLSGATAPVVYIDTTDTGGNYVLENPQGLAFGPDGYLYVGNNLDPTGTPDQGSRVLRFDVSGSTGVFAGVLTTEHREIRSLSYDNLYDRLIVSLNAQADIWAYTDLSLDYVAENDASFEYIYNADAEEDFPSAVRIGEKVYFSDMTNDIIRRVDSSSSAGIALDTTAGLLDPEGLLVLWDDPFDFDQDDDVDLDDYAVFETLIVGPGVTTAPAGVDQADFDRADIDGDGDVDLYDWMKFTEHFNAG